MNRRRAIFGVLALTGSGYLGFKLYEISKNEDLSRILNEKLLIAELADTVIPKSDTPGAKDVNAADTIVKLLIECGEIKVQRNFVKGFDKVNNLSQKLFQKKFVGCSLNERVEVLSVLERESRYSISLFNKIHKKVWGDSFTNILKEYTVRAYCTSMKGATQGLAYLAIPGKRASCIDLAPGQKSWATQ